MKATNTTIIINGQSITASTIEDCVKAYKSLVGTQNEGKVIGKPDTTNKSIDKPTTASSGKTGNKTNSGKGKGTTTKGGKKSTTTSGSKNGKGSATAVTTKKVVKKRSKAELEAYHKFCQKFWQKAWASAEYKRLRSAKSRSEFNKSKLVELNAQVKAKGL